MINVAIDSYNTVYQRGGGGIPMRIAKIQNGLSAEGINVALFDKWNDKLSDFQILHVFKDNIDSFAEIVYAKESGLKIVISSVIPQEGGLKIKLGLALYRLFKINNTYSYLRHVLMLSDAIVAQTKKESVFIQKNYGINGSKIHIIPNGIHESVVNSYDPTISKDIVLCVGRFDRNKNQLNLIRALKGINVPVHFVGGPVPDEKDYYEACLKEADNSPYFVFHGWLKQGSDDLINLFQRAKVSVLISHKEIFGNAFVEGAAAGANLVVTKSLPVHEYGFREGYYQVAPTDVNGIKEAILVAYKKDVPKDLRENAIKRYSWESVILKHIKLYETLLSH